jgi:WD40 repeat protein
MAFDPGGQILASGGDDGTIRFWDVATGQPGGRPLTGLAGVNGLAWSPDGQILASAHQGEVDNLLLWDPVSGQLLDQTEAGHADGVGAVAFAPDGRTLASGGLDGTVHLWDVADLGRGMQSLGQLGEGLGFSVRGLAFSLDGHMLALGGNQLDIILWDLSNLQEGADPLPRSLEGNGEFVLSLAFSPDGRTLASGGFDRQVTLWDVASSQRLGPPLTGHDCSVRSVAFSPDGRTLTSGGSDGSLLLWNVDLASWQEQACQIANRPLTQDEWQHYLGSGHRYRETCPAPEVP